MKAKNGPLAIVKIGRNTDQPKRLIAYIFRKCACVLRGGDLIGGVSGRTDDDYDGLGLGHHGEGREIRSVIISLSVPPNKTTIDLYSKELGQCCLDFRKKFAPGCPVLFAIHKQGAKLHAHILVRNSDGEKCLEWGPDAVKKMQSFEWTSTFPSGRGHGQTKVSGKTTYPAKTMVAAELAAMTTEDLKPLLKAGALSVTRKRKDGSPVTIQYKDKRIRVQTINTYDNLFAERLEEAIGHVVGNDESEPKTAVKTMSELDYSKPGIEAEPDGSMPTCTEGGEDINEEESDREPRIKKPNIKILPTTPAGIATYLVGLAVEGIQSLLETGQLSIGTRQRDGTAKSLVFQGIKVGMDLLLDCDPTFSNKFIKASKPLFFRVNKQKIRLNQRQPGGGRELSR